MAITKEELKKAILNQQSMILDLRASNKKLRGMAIHVYNSGYHAGHHDTVEGGYVDIHSNDMDSYHAETVEELVDWLATH